MPKKKPERPVIYIAFDEKNKKIRQKLEEFGKDRGVDIKEKRTRTPGDYVIVDLNGNRWGIEYKSFIDCYSSIITHEGTDNSRRIYGQLAELVKEFDGRAIFLLGAPEYIPKPFRGRGWLIKKIVYSFFSRRSLLMPTWFLAGPTHIAQFMVDTALRLHKEEFHGRGVKVQSYIPSKKKKKRK